ncbi:ECF transporter S component [Ruminococcaceae bacterium OttesenSCG-928-L11]|nr:ECF transporter S component [Ruminococcaceae bacterium OttesenSCG-928-L11]
MSHFIKTKQLVFAALCIALGLVLPMLFHGIPNAGSIFLPMHIPVLLCGLICGWPYGLICGALTPLLSSILTGMPPAAILPAMLCELAVYGLMAGLLIQLVRTPKSIANIYVSLVGAMLCGRLVAGAVKALIFNVGAYSMQAWIASSFVTALPGILLQLIVIPIVVQALRQARIITVPQHS